MPTIIFYDFWQKGDERKPIAKMSEFSEIQTKKGMQIKDLKNAVILLNNQEYRIINIDKHQKKESMADHHTTKEEFIYEIIVEKEIK